ncbi:MAG: hypothetical protein WCL50_10965 [Spirochaetota bacterium]
MFPAKDRDSETRPSDLSTNVDGRHDCHNLRVGGYSCLSRVFRN